MFVDCTNARTTVVILVDKYWRRCPPICIHIVEINLKSAFKLLKVILCSYFTRKLLIGKKTGLKIFDIENVELLHEYSLTDVYLVEILGSPDIVGAVCLKKPMELKVIDLKNSKEVCGLCYTSCILRMTSNSETLVLCLEDRIEIVKLRGLKPLQTLTNLPTGYKGLCALSTMEASCFLAYPLSDLDGVMQIFNVVKQSQSTLIRAHRSPLSAMAFHPSRSIIATSSTKGTIIRLTSVPSGDKLCELRRGLQRSAVMYSLAFSSDGDMLCSSSHTGTVHVFKIDSANQDWIQFVSRASGESNVYSHSTTSTFSSSLSRSSTTKPKTWTGFLAEWLPSNLALVPRRISDTCLGYRSFIKARLRSPDKNFSHFVMVKSSPRIVVASQDGGLYFFSLEENKDGECTLSSDPLNLDHI